MDIKYGILFFIIFGFVADSAAAEYYSAASFTEDARSLQNIIKFPEIEGDASIIVLCETDVTRSGRFGNTSCVSNREKYAMKFEIAVLRAVKRTKIKAASLDGKQKSVWFQFTVQFVQKGGVKTIYAFSNHGEESEKYGQEYSSPQRLTQGNFKVIARAFRRCGANARVMIRAVIDTSGVPIDAKHIGGEGNSGCKADMAAYFLEGRFIPAISNGKPVTSVYVQTFANKFVTR